MLREVSLFINIYVVILIDLTSNREINGAKKKKINLKKLNFIFKKLSKLVKNG